MAEDPVAKAIEATDPNAVTAIHVQVRLSSGRPVVMLVPEDLTKGEALDIVGFVSTGLGGELERQRAARKPTSRLIVPTLGTPAVLGRRAGR